MTAFFFALNVHLFMEINAAAGHWTWLDDCMIFCANFLIFFWPILMLVLWGRPLSWRKRQLRPGEAEIVQECRAAVLWIAVACLVAYALNLGVEQFIFEPRPFVTYHVHLLVSHPADSSFPSDHTAWSFGVVGMMIFSLPAMLHRVGLQRIAIADQQKQAVYPLLRPLLIMVIALMLACCIGFARVFVGVHYPGDVLGGAISGLIAAAIVTFFRHRVFQKLTALIMQFAQHIHLA